MKKTFYSNGKLLLTGEYTVLDGAKAFALPTKYGQYLHIEEDIAVGEKIFWKSLDADGSVWYEDNITISDIINNRTPENNSITSTLITILYKAHLQNPDILEKATGLIITTELTFPKHWGLGTSSTLINNIAKWFSIDAYRLLWDSFGGSGYDIACAQHNTPILYQIIKGKPTVTPIAFKPSFTDNLYFIYLNQKQDSRKAIASYREKENDINSIISQINMITNAAANANKSINNFTALLDEHEAIMSQVLSTPTVKESLFPDFKGSLKSLGAWGGDFILAIAKDNPTAYFKKKGYTTIISYDDMIL
ncbi:GHMP kinase [Flavobacterium arcticum]|uniref:GHMP kinase n=1 Tax=Flavobacterium arcticum TaxID=1784713 RepID=A0A345HF54_9FLAO|nr:GYDIA family GHMP kinase [Flavobacterium arcticum]AXG75214.1 GHMP kinase [Flavobacterium arcticum]KAF2513150.1 GHMP kinase [Flavobacterium arcticum]